LGTEYEKQEQREQLEECSNGASKQDVDDNILITQEYAGSLASSLQLSWLPTLFALDFLLLYGQTISGAVTGNPVDWSFDAGVYSHAGTTAAIEMRVLLTEDSGYGPAGTQVTEDIFELESYLEGATVTPNEDGSVTIDYVQPGPAVELLGLGAEPPNPLTLTAEEREIIIDNLSTLALEPDYVSYGVTPLLTWDMHWVSPPETIASIANGDLPIDIELVEVNAQREDTGQALSTDVWDVNQRSGDVGGFTTFTVSGGSFPFGGRIEFTSTPFTIVLAERELDCL
jgi:hypothetical protein